MEAVTAPRPAREWETLKETTLCAAFQHTAAATPERVALRLPGDEISITYAEYADRVRAIAAGLAACGVGMDDPLGLMLRNTPEFHLVDTGAIHVGAAPFSIYNTNPPDEIEFLVRDSQTRIVITEMAFAQRVLEVARRVDELETVVLVDGEAEGAITLAELESRGAEDFDFEAAWRAVTPDTVLTIVYTSGTTGEPKGVKHTHATIMSGLKSMHWLCPVSDEGRVVSFLPMAHIAERYISHYGSMAFGYTITCCANLKEVGKAFVDARPTRLFAVPRVYEKTKAALDAALAGEPDPERKRAVEQAIEVGLAKVRAEQADEEVSQRLAADYARADEQVLHQLREKIGLDRLEWVSVAAAPTPYHVLEYFHAIGVRIAELWGMSETVLSTSNPQHRIKLGTVGYHLPGVEVELADDGEILVRGPNVSIGYWGRPALTAEAFDADGWMHSGDVATADDEGYLTIVDRKKELIINAAGKNMSPAKIENAIKESAELIGQVLCIGDGRPYNVALLVLDPDAAGGWARANGLGGAATEEVAADERVRGAVAEGVERANARLARVEQIKYFELLHAEWLPGGDELTPTSKLKRKPIATKYAEQIEALYAASR